MVQETGDAFVESFENWTGDETCIKALEDHFADQSSEWLVRDVRQGKADTMRIARRNAMCQAYVQELIS